jgi:hypothetical protein
VGSVTYIVYTPCLVCGVAVCDVAGPTVLFFQENAGSILS